jgi:hypothetical protein
MPEIRTLNGALLKGIAPGTWVAISEDQERFVGTGQTIDEAIQKAHENGQAKPCVIRVPAEHSALIV